jgi:hypothetical protein
MHNCAWVHGSVLHAMQKSASCRQPTRQIVCNSVDACPFNARVRDVSADVIAQPEMQIYDVPLGMSCIMIHV